MLDREAGDVGMPNTRQVRRRWSPPPEPERLRGLGGARQVLDLQAQEHAAPQRPRTAGAPARVLLGLGMQPAPGLQLDVAVLRILGRPLFARLGPRRRVVADELGPMPPRSAGRR